MIGAKKKEPGVLDFTAFVLSVAARTKNGGEDVDVAGIRGQARLTGRHEGV